MATKKITQLNPSSPSQLSTGDVFAIVDTGAGETRKSTFKDYGEFVLGNGQILVKNISGQVRSSGDIYAYSNIISSGNLRARSGLYVGFSGVNGYVNISGRFRSFGDFKHTGSMEVSGDLHALQDLNIGQNLNVTGLSTFTDYAYLNNGASVGTIGGGQALFVWNNILGLDDANITIGEGRFNSISLTNPTGGNINATGNLGVNGDFILNGDATLGDGVSSSHTINGSVSVGLLLSSPTISASSLFSSSGPAVFSSTITGSSNVNIDGVVTARGVVVEGTNLTVEQNSYNWLSSYIGRHLFVTGQMSSRSGLYSKGDLGVESNLKISGNSVLGNSTSNSTTVSGPIYITGSTHIIGQSYFTGQANFAGDIKTSGITSLGFGSEDLVVIGGPLKVIGGYENIFYNNVDFRGDNSIRGKIVVSGSDGIRTTLGDVYTRNFFATGHQSSNHFSGKSNFYDVISGVNVTGNRFTGQYGDFNSLTSQIGTFSTSLSTPILISTSTSQFVGLNIFDAGSENYFLGTIHSANASAEFGGLTGSLLVATSMFSGQEGRFNGSIETTGNIITNSSIVSRGSSPNTFAGGVRSNGILSGQTIIGFGSSSEHNINGARITLTSVTYPITISGLVRQTGYNSSLSPKENLFVAPTVFSGDINVSGLISGFSFQTGFALNSSSPADICFDYRSKTTRWGESVPDGTPPLKNIRVYLECTGAAGEYDYVSGDCLPIECALPTSGYLLVSTATGVIFKELLTPRLVRKDNSAYGVSFNPTTNFWRYKVVVDKTMPETIGHFDLLD